MIVKYSAEGADVLVVIVTRGEVGEIAPDSAATREMLGAVREDKTHFGAYPSVSSTRSRPLMNLKPALMMVRPAYIRRTQLYTATLR